MNTAGAMESDAERGCTLRSRLMELLYSSNGSTFTMRQLSTILAASESNIQHEIQNNDLLRFNENQRSVQLREQFTDELKSTAPNQNGNVNEVNDDEIRNARSLRKSDISGAPKENNEFTAAPRQGKRTLFDFTSAAHHLSAYDNFNEEDKADNEYAESSSNERRIALSKVYHEEAKRNELERRGGMRRNASRRRVAVRSKSRKRGGARDENRTAIPTGQVGRVGYVCVADEFNLAGLESHYRNLGYFTKFDFDVLHVRFADEEMQRSVSPFSRNSNHSSNNNNNNNNNNINFGNVNADSKNAINMSNTKYGNSAREHYSDGYDEHNKGDDTHDDEKSWNYGATALNSNRMSPLTKEHASLPVRAYVEHEMSYRGSNANKSNNKRSNSADSSNSRSSNRHSMHANAQHHSGRSVSSGNVSKPKQGKRTVSKRDNIRGHHSLSNDNKNDKDVIIAAAAAVVDNDGNAITTTTGFMEHGQSNMNNYYTREAENKEVTVRQAAYSPQEDWHGSNYTGYKQQNNTTEGNRYNGDTDSNKEVRTNINYRVGFDLFIFEYGAVVWWGFDQRYFKIVENDFMLPDSAIAKYVVNRYTTKLVNENYPVWCTYNLLRKERLEADEDFKRRLRFDHFLIPYGQGDVNTSGISMLCASHALAQSAKIDYLEIKVQELTENCSPLPRDLKEKGGVSISERRLLQLRGEVLSYRLMLKSGSDLLDEPDLFWENAYLKPVFQATKEGFEISERVEALDNKLDAANEILSILADEFSQRHGARLEWIVIWLVFVEVIIGVLELVVDSRPWFYKH